MNAVSKSSMTGKGLGIVVVVLGFLVAIVPHYVFPVCQYFGLHIELGPGIYLPMPCWYTAMAEVGVGAVVVTLGLMFFFSIRNETRRALGFVLAALGIVVALLPVYLIPVCPEVWHPCHIATLPALVLLGCALVIVAVATVVAYRGVTPA
jgi:hypothetical protein